jgi:threonine/homoserine/homoserine lactone efflux protein
MDADVVRMGATVGLAVAMPLGPIGLMVVGLARRGWRTGGAAAAGVATADLTWAVVAVTGGAAVAALPGIAAWQVAARVTLGTIGALLVVRGMRRLRHGGRPAATTPAPSRSSGRWFVVLYGLTLPNPLTVAVFTAAALSTSVGGRVADRVAFAFGVGAASLLWQLALAAVGRHVVARSGPGVEGVLTVAAGALLVMWPLLG